MCVLCHLYANKSWTWVWMVELPQKKNRLLVDDYIYSGIASGWVGSGRKPWRFIHCEFQV